MSPMKAR